MWLKYYVYLRMLPNDKTKSTSTTQFIAALTTFVVSAIWHGFYPGFYIFFINVAFVDYVSKHSAKVVYPLVEGKMPESVLYAFSWLFCYSQCAYHAPAFILLSFEYAWKLYSSMNFVGHI